MPGVVGLSTGGQRVHRLTVRESFATTGSGLLTQTVKGSWVLAGTGGAGLWGGGYEMSQDTDQSE